MQGAAHSGAQQQPCYCSAGACVAIHLAGHNGQYSLTNQPLLRGEEVYLEASATALHMSSSAAAKPVLAAMGLSMPLHAPANGELQGAFFAPKKVIAALQASATNY